MEAEEEVRSSGGLGARAGAELLLILQLLGLSLSPKGAWTLLCHSLSTAAPIAAFLCTSLSFLTLVSLWACLSTLRVVL